MAALPEPQQGTAAGWQNRDFVKAVISRCLELDGWNFRFEKLSISRIYDYIWVEIAYGLEEKKFWCHEHGVSGLSLKKELVLLLKLWHLEFE